MTPRNRLLVLPTLLAVLASCGKKDDDAGKAPAPPPPSQVFDAAAPAPPPPADPGDAYLAYIAAFNERDPKGLTAAFADDATLTLADTPDTTAGAAAIVEADVALWKAMPDTKLEPQLVLVRDRRVAALVLGHGTHTGPMATPAGEVPATGAETGAFGVEIVDINDVGTIAKATQYLDVGLLAAQLQKAKGAFPAIREGAASPTVAIADASAPPMAAALQTLTEGDGATAFKAARVALEAAGVVLAPDATLWFSGAPSEYSGAKPIGGFFGQLTRAFPDLAIEVDELWGAGNYVVAVARYKGTHKAPWPPLAPKATGKAIDVAVAHVLEVEGMTIRRAWIVVNTMALRSQLGLMPSE